MTHPEPFDAPLDEFLRGEDEADLDVDPVFAKDFARVWDEFVRFAPSQIVPDAKDAPIPSLLAPGYHYREVEAGILLMDISGNPVGGYLSCDLSLDEAHQGRGLGAEIVIERCLRDGMNPVLHLDACSYSPAGLAAHAAAWRHARSHPDETAERVRRISQDK